jgi:uridine kinase
MSLAQVVGRQGVLIIEGIHALNPHYTAKIADSEKFRIYISPLTSLQVSDPRYRKARQGGGKEAKSLGPGKHASLAAKPAQDARRTRVGGGG